MTRHRPYPSGLSEARWELIGPCAHRPAGRAQGEGPRHRLPARARPAPHHGRHPLRRPHRHPPALPPRDFAPRETVYGYFAARQKDGVFGQLNGLLRRPARKAEGRDGEPSACVLDAQSVKTSSNVPAAGQGIDAGKKIAGRKRRIGVDTLGLLLTVWVTAASVSDNAGGMRLMSHSAATHPRVTKARADTGYRTKALDHGARLGIDVEVVQRDPASKASRRSRDAGWSSGPSAGSCTAAASPATAKLTPIAPKP